MSTFTPLPRRSELVRKPYTVDISDLLPEHSDCPICRLPLTEECEPIRFHSTHAFCKECILAWFQKSRTCPYCMQPAWSRLGRESQRLDRIVRQYLSVDPDHVADNVLIFDEDVMQVRHDLTIQGIVIKSAIRERAERELSDEQLAELQYERSWIHTRRIALVQWRSEMYEQAPDQVIWSPIESGRVDRIHARGSQHRPVKVQFNHAVRALDTALSNAPVARDPNIVVTEQVRSVLSHPLRYTITGALEDAVREVNGRRMSAWELHQHMQRRVNERTPRLLERVAQGRDEALVMQGFVATLIVRIVEAQQKCKKVKGRSPARVIVEASEVPEQLQGEVGFQMIEDLGMVNGRGCA
ncbi:hypothetical protein LTR95_008208 [Oleoguttula sp. CCFEE 5521]